MRQRVESGAYLEKADLRSVVEAIRALDKIMSSLFLHRTAYAHDETLTMQVGALELSTTEDIKQALFSLRAKGKEEGWPLDLVNFEVDQQLQTVANGVASFKGYFGDKSGYTPQDRVRALKSINNCLEVIEIVSGVSPAACSKKR